jgi:enoyl-CoA hydratase/carnithine racemase
MAEFTPGENPIRFQLEDGIATVTLDRPAQRNALSIEAMNASMKSGNRSIRPRGDESPS